MPAVPEAAYRDFPFPMLGRPRTVRIMAEVWIRSAVGAAIVRADEVAAFTVVDDALRAILRSGEALPLLSPRPLAGVPALHDRIEVEVMAAAAGARTAAADIVVLEATIDPERRMWVFACEQMLGKA